MAVFRKLEVSATRAGMIQRSNDSSHASASLIHAAASLIHAAASRIHAAASPIHAAANAV